MPRLLDLVSLRSFVGVVEAGGVTRAAGFLNLTQSAVSMQIKRLEEALDLQLFDRSARRLALTAEGEVLLGYARRLLAVNDEAVARLMAPKAPEGELVLGVPHDIVYPAIPQVLQRFARDFPRMKVTLLSSVTRVLKEQFARGECDAILTTEDQRDPGGETLVDLPLVWVGAPGGQAWRGRPLRLAYEHHCLFRGRVQAALDAAGIPWEIAVESSSTRTVEASVSADLAVHTVLAGSEPPQVERIVHGGALPDLPRMQVNLYVATSGQTAALQALAGFLRQAFAGARTGQGLAQGAVSPLSRAS